MTWDSGIRLSQPPTHQPLTHFSKSEFPHLWNKGGVNPLWRVAVRMPWAGALTVLTGCPAWSEARETGTVTHWRLGHLATWPPGKFRPCLSAWGLSSACPCALPSFLSEKANESGHRQQKDQSPPEKKTQVCAQVSGLGLMNRTQRHNLRRHAMAPKDFWRFCTHQWSLYSLLDPELQPHPWHCPQSSHIFSLSVAPRPSSMLSFCLAHSSSYLPPVPFACLFPTSPLEACLHATSFRKPSWTTMPQAVQSPLR